MVTKNITGLNIVLSANQFADGKNHINEIENFVGLWKCVWQSRGVNKNTFYLHLKECEFRYNNRDKTDKELYLYILKLIKKFNKKL